MPQAGLPPLHPPGQEGQTMGRAGWLFIQPPGTLTESIIRINRKKQRNYEGVQGGIWRGEEGPLIARLSRLKAPPPLLPPPS